MSWKSLDPSPKQINLLRKLGYDGTPATRGEASSKIDELLTIRKRTESLSQISEEPKCAECGKKGYLVADLEDGLLKHPNCCDMPPYGDFD